MRVCVCVVCACVCVLCVCVRVRVSVSYDAEREASLIFAARCSPPAAPHPPTHPPTHTPNKHKTHIQGGRTNAYTAAEDTSYSFDVNAAHLEPALDRFAQFFVGPLISADGIAREVRAVDSEHSKNVNADGWR